MREIFDNWVIGDWLKVSELWVVIGLGIRCFWYLFRRKVDVRGNFFWYIGNFGLFYVLIIRVYNIFLVIGNVDFKDKFFMFDWRLRFIID